MTRVRTWLEQSGGLPLIIAALVLMGVLVAVGGQWYISVFLGVIAVWIIIREKGHPRA